MNTSNIVFTAIKNIEVGTARQVADEAEVSIGTARKWLAQFVDQGSVRKTTPAINHSAHALYLIVPELPLTAFESAMLNQPRFTHSD